MMMSAIQANRRMNIGRPQPMVSSASGTQISSGQDQRDPSIEKITCQGVVSELHLKELDLKAHYNRYSRPVTHPDLIGISQFFSANLELSRFPNSTCENPGFLFCFEIG